MRPSDDPTFPAAGNTAPARPPVGHHANTPRRSPDWFPGPGFAELREALFSWVAGAAEAWQIPEDEVVRMRTSMEDETMYERVKEMREQVHRAGVELGLERGLEQGLERGRAEGRALVGRLATRKFGAEAAAQLARLLEDIADPERLAEIADAIIDCDSHAELFARVGG